jgi:hypothetical protein
VIGRILCRLNRHAWDLPRIVHWLIIAAPAYTVPVRVQDCLRFHCHEQRQERVNG